MKDEVKIEIESDYAPPYSIEYDGKYVTLIGGDKNYPVHNYFGTEPPDQIEYEEMVLIPVVIERRHINPAIKEVTDTHIIISLNPTTP